MHHIHQFLNLGDRMDFGALMFFTDYAISAVDLPQADWARTHSTIETLIALRWLRTDKRDDLSAIVKAFRRFAGRSLNSGPDRWYIP